MPSSRFGFPRSSGRSSSFGYPWPQAVATISRGNWKVLNSPESISETPRRTYRDRKSRSGASIHHSSRSCVELERSETSKESDRSPSPVVRFRLDGYFHLIGKPSNLSSFLLWSVNYATSIASNLCSTIPIFGYIINFSLHVLQIFLKRQNLYFWNKLNQCNHCLFNHHPRFFITGQLLPFQFLITDLTNKIQRWPPPLETKAFTIFSTSRITVSLFILWYNPTLFRNVNLSGRVSGSWRPS